MVLIGTIYDLFKRARIYFETSILSNSLIFTDLLRLNKAQHKEIHLENTRTDEINDLNNEKENKTTLITKLMLNFSFYNNTLKLFKTNDKPGQLDCLNAIRVLSMGYVVLGHLIVYGIFYTENQGEISNWIKYPSFQIITTATYSVDSFFLISYKINLSLLLYLIIIIILIFVFINKGFTYFIFISERNV